MRWLSFIFLFLFVSQTAISQSIIKGTVKDNAGDPIPGVNVYLAGTTFGATTDNNGFYKFRSTVPGQYDLVFSFVGYEKQIRRVRLSSSSTITSDATLEENTQHLQEIVVKASNKKWRERYELFFDELIGTSEYAEQVTIENPWVLSFEERNNDLIARSQKPLTIINKALGYKLYVELISFQWSKYPMGGGSYKIYPKYTLLDPEDEEEHHRWKENRLENYMGSLTHFLKSLYHNRLKENDFSIQQPWNLKKLPYNQSKHLLLTSRGAPNSYQKKAKGYALENYVKVEYNGSMKYNFGDKTHTLSIEKSGGAVPNTDRYFFVDGQGKLFNPTSIALRHRWAADRVANSLPTNYRTGD